MKPTHLSLFSGIGGLDLAAEWAGFQTVGQCEWADYPTKVLEKHWPNVTRWRDIRTLTKESFYDQTGLRTVDIISGGFPCQPFSVAGKQKGRDDDRYLWPEMLRVIRELAPAWVVGENVPGILRIAGRTVCEDLECEGYAVTVLNFEAAAVGAPHRRDRVFFIANRHGNDRDARWTESKGQQRQAGTANGGDDVADTDAKREPQSKGDVGAFGGWTRDGSENVANAHKPGSQGRERGELQECSGERAAGEGGTHVSDTYGERLQACGPHGGYGVQGTETANDCCEAQSCRDGDQSSWWSAEPNVGRVAHGVPARVDRLKCLGNAVVPQQAYPIFAAIAEIERSTTGYEH